jgi:hypothetical protein
MLLVFAALLGFDYNADVKKAVGFAVGNDQCEQGAADSDSIVICGVRRTNHFRIDPAARSSWQSDHKWHSRPSRWLGFGNSIGSCSAVGPGGYTGCLSRQIQSWKDGGGHLKF